MPCPPGSIFDQWFGGPFVPDQDATAADDGWRQAERAARRRQVAGLVALLIERARSKGVTLTTEKVRDLLQQTAVAVEQGSSAQGFPAAGHPNIAVGFGLVDASAALGRV